MKYLLLFISLFIIFPVVLMADIVGQNYKGNPNPDVGAETVFVDCNFEQPAPNIDPNGVITGVRLFPGDDTPRTFIHCRLINCELPPGSTMERCGIALVLPNTVIATRTYTIDGVDLTLDIIGIKVKRNGVTQNIGKIPPAIAPIDTTAQLYNQLLTAVGLLQSQTADKLEIYKYLPADKRTQWLQRDPLFKQTLLLIKKIGERIGEIQNVQDD